MTEFLQGLQIADLGAGGILAIAVVSIVVGWLVPKGTMDKILVVKDQQIEWLRDAHDTEQQISAELSKQNSALLEGTQISVKVAEALRAQLPQNKGE